MLEFLSWISLKPDTFELEGVVHKFLHLCERFVSCSYRLHKLSCIISSHFECPVNDHQIRGLSAMLNTNLTEAGLQHLLHLPIFSTFLHARLMHSKLDAE